MSRKKFWQFSALIEALAMEIRPRPEQCMEWGRAAGFHFNDMDRYDLPPYHYGLLFRKPFD